MANPKDMWTYLDFHYFSILEILMWPSDHLLQRYFFRRVFFRREPIFFLCMRPPIMETDDGDYIKLPPTVTGKTSGRRNPGLQHWKRVAPEKFGR